MRFSGLSPLEPGHGTIDVHIEGVGDVDLRNDCDLMNLELRLTPSASVAQLVFDSVKWKSRFLIEFHRVQLLEGVYEPLDAVLEEDRTLFQDLMFWRNGNVEGFSVETAVAHVVIACSDIVLTVTSL